MTARILGALAALVSAAVHLYEWGWGGYSSLPVVGPAFVFNAAAGVVIAGLLSTWRHWIPLFLLFGFGLVTMGAFVASTTVGLFGVHETWTGFAVWAAVIAEAAAIVLAVAIAAREGYLELGHHIVLHNRPAGRTHPGSRSSAITPDTSAI